MPIKRRPGKIHVSGELTAVEMAFLRDEPLPPDAGFEADSAWWQMERGDDDAGFRPGRPSVRDMWSAMGADIVAEWVQDAPGTRPSCWWRCASEPRRRLDDGPGKPGWPDRLRYGKPTGWVWPQVWPAGATIVGGPPECDPADPPVYESQAAYLRRLGLLMDDEAERLTDADFEPEVIKPR